MPVSDHGRPDIAPGTRLEHLRARETRKARRRFVQGAVGGFVFGLLAGDHGVGGDDRLSVVSRLLTFQRVFELLLGEDVGRIRDHVGARWRVEPRLKGFVVQEAIDDDPFMSEIVDGGGNHIDRRCPERQTRDH